MGGTDLYMFMSLYKVDHNSMKWYRRIFFWVLTSCVVQGWILYKRHCEHLRAPRKDRRDLLSFATSVSKVLVACDSENVGESVAVGGHLVTHLKCLMKSPSKSMQKNELSTRRVPRMKFGTTKSAIGHLWLNSQNEGVAKCAKS